MILLNELDLEKSFDKLKGRLNESETVRHDAPLGYAQAYINLRQGVLLHLKECVGEEININVADPNDLKNINI